MRAAKKVFPDNGQGFALRDKLAKGVNTAGYQKVCRHRVHTSRYRPGYIGFAIVASPLGFLPKDSSRFFCRVSGNPLIGERGDEEAAPRHKITAVLQSSKA